MLSGLPDFSPELQKALADREQQLFDLVLSQSGGIVQRGPFRGLKLAPTYSWLYHGHLVPQWLGEYEEQLHSTIEQLCSMHATDTFVNFGCGNGYYAAGWARRNPGAEIHAIDLDLGAIALSKENAELNGVLDKITFYSDYDPLFAAIGNAERKIFFMDIEGHEADAVDQLAGMSLTHEAILVIECHDVGYLDKNITNRLITTLSPTHTIERIDSRNNGTDRPDLRIFSDLDRFIATTEWRPASMHWLFCIPRSYSETK